MDRLPAASNITDRMEDDDDLSDVMDIDDPESQQESTKKRRGDPPDDSDYKAKLRKTYHKGGLVHSLHGVIYQLKLLMLFLKRAIEKEYKFQLGTEVEDADKFDDIVFKHENDDVTGADEVRFVQIKHKQNESKKITIDELLKPYNAKDNDFSLQKYFISYRKILRNPKFSKYKLENFTIFTNINFDLDNESIKIESVDEDDDILDMTHSDKDTERCKLIIPKDDELYEKFRETSDLHVLAKAIKNLLEDKKQNRALDLNAGIFKTYHIALSNNVFDISKGKNRIARFRDEFLDDIGLSEDVSEFRRVLQQALNLDNDTFKQQLSQKELKASEKFGKQKINASQPLVDEFDRFSIEPKEKEEQEATTLPTDRIDDAEIQDFFNKLVFAVNQPNEVELGTIIAYEMGESSNFNLLNADLVSDSLQREMLDWFKAKRPEKNEEGEWLDERSGKKLMKSIEQKVSSVISIGLNVTYPEKLADYGIKFKENDMSKHLKDFLSNESVSEILHVKAAKDTLLSAINVYGAIEDLKTQTEYSQYKKYDSHIFIRLDTLLGKKTQRHIIEAFKSKDNHYLLIIDGNCEKSGTQKLFNNLCKIVQGAKKKIILISTQQNDLGNEFAKRVRSEIIDNVSFSDLTEESKGNLLQREIIFQGKKVSFDVLLDKSDSITNDIIDVDIMHKLLRGDEIIISKKPQELGEVKDYYIKRRFMQVALSKEYLEKNTNHSELFVINGVTDLKQGNVFNCDNAELTERKFEELCHQNPRANVHWLEGLSGNFAWCKSHGSISKIVSDDRIYLPLFDEAQLINGKDVQRVVVISDLAGMGKSAVLCNLSTLMKERSSGLWLIRINLNDHTALLDQVLDMRKTIKSNDYNKRKETLDLLLNELIAFQEKSEMERKLFNNVFYNHGRVVFLFDGFDEISPDYKDLVKDLLLSLQKTKAERIFVTSRSNLRNELEKALQVFSLRLEPLTKNEQFEFLTNFWITKLGLHSLDEHYTQRLNTYVESVIKNISELISGKGVFIGIPLQTMMIAEIFQENQTGTLSDRQGCKEFLESQDWKPKLLKPQSLHDLYERFIRKKIYKFHLEAKKKRTLTIVGERDKADYDYKEMKEKYSLLALMTLFDSRSLKNLLSDEENNKLVRLVEGFETFDHNEGIVDQFINNKPNFIHRTFAEYFGAFAVVQKILASPVNIIQVLNNTIWRMSSIFVHNFIEELNGKVEKITPILNMPLCQYLINKSHKKIMYRLIVSSHVETDWHKKLDVSGKTPLHYIAENGYTLNYRDVLLSAGFMADLWVPKKEEKQKIFANMQDINGKTALDYALDKKHYDVAFDLLEHLPTTVSTLDNFSHLRKVVYKNGAGKRIFSNDFGVDEYNLLYGHFTKVSPLSVEFKSEGKEGIVHDQLSRFISLVYYNADKISYILKSTEENEQEKDKFVMAWMKLRYVCNISRYENVPFLMNSPENERITLYRPPPIGS